MFTPKENGFFKDAPNHDRFNMPEGIIRVTGGLGGDSFLVLGSEKTLMYDCGMACFYRETLSNVHEILDPLNRTIDYIVLSHTHYDHIGALPYVLKEFPDAVVMGSEACIKVFNSETAKNTMESLGEGARLLYQVEDVKVTAEGMRLDKVLHDLDEINLGDKKVVAYETPGHTNCSMCYGIDYQDEAKENVLLMCESVGTYDGNHIIEPSALKSYTQTKESAQRLKGLNYPVLMAMHYGVIEAVFSPHYFDTYIKSAIAEEDFFTKELESGKTDEEIFEDHKAIWWTDDRELNQPFGAYSTNTHITIARLRKELKR